MDLDAIHADTSLFPLGTFGGREVIWRYLMDDLPPRLVNGVELISDAYKADREAVEGASVATLTTLSL